MRAHSAQPILGIDLGGSYLKAAHVDPASGQIRSDVHRIATPQPATPDRVLDAIARLATRLEVSHTVGFGFPGVVREGIVATATNVDSAWIGVNVESLLSARLQSAVVSMNDADAAGLAELQWGAIQGQRGCVLMLTVGTGVGSALFMDGRLLPNTELGQIDLHGMRAEISVSAKARSSPHITWMQWAGRLAEYLKLLHSLLWPDVIVIGGDMSEQFQHFGPLISAPVDLRPAYFGGQGGVVGAAMAAATLSATRAEKESSGSPPENRGGARGIDRIM